MKGYSNPTRLLLFGGMLLTAEVLGSENEESSPTTHLRRKKHRALQEAPAADQTGFNPRNHYGYGYNYGYGYGNGGYGYGNGGDGYGNNGYYQPMQPPPPPPPGYYYSPYDKKPQDSSAPSYIPSAAPSAAPSVAPSVAPTRTPTPTTSPTFAPTFVTEDPTFTPTFVTPAPTDPPNTGTPTVFVPPTPLPTLGPDTVIFSLQDTAGVCNGPGNGIGCANENPDDPPAGNPNDIVNCFNAADAGVDLPFSLNAVRVWIGDSTVLTPDLEVNIWVGFADGGGPDPDRLLYSEEVFGYTFGENTFELQMARMIFTQDFCVGVTARSSNAGLRIATDDGGTGESSYLRSPECGVLDFVSLLNLFQDSPNDFCIEAIATREDF